MTIKDIQKKFSNAEITKPEYIELMHQAHRNLFEYAELIGHTDIAKIEITDNEVVMTSRENEVKIFCGFGDKRIAPIEILNFQHYEKVDSDLMYRLIENGDQVIDIGANIGWYSINFGKRYPDSQILAIEPVPKTFSHLEENIHLNSSSNVKAFNHGFSNETSELSFYYPPSESGNASLARLTDASDVELITCQVLRLDDFIGDLQHGIDFIKCDVEGAELLVFQGGIEALRANKPIVFCEMLRKWSAKFDYHPNDTIQLFSDLGYRCFVAQGENLVEFFSMDENTLETNYYFLHAEKHASKIAELLR